MCPGIELTAAFHGCMADMNRAVSNGSLSLEPNPMILL